MPMIPVAVVPVDKIWLVSQKYSVPGLHTGRIVLSPFADRNATAPVTPTVNALIGARRNALSLGVTGKLSWS
jgi:hypothetical protein